MAICPAICLGSILQMCTLLVSKGNVNSESCVLEHTSKYAYTVNTKSAPVTHGSQVLFLLVGSWFLCASAMGQEPGSPETGRLCLVLGTVFPDSACVLAYIA